MITTKYYCVKCQKTNNESFNYLCYDCNEELKNTCDAEIKVSKKNIMDIFEEFKENNSIYESTFIPNKEEFKYIFNDCKLNLGSFKWYSYFLGDNEYNRSIMFTVEQATELINYIVKIYQNNKHDIYKYCCALDSFILLIESMKDVQPYFKNYSWHITNKKEILKNWKDKYGRSKRLLAPIIIGNCILCDTFITQKGKFTICIHCNKIIHYKCNIAYHRNLLILKKKILCNNCNEPNIKLNKDIDVHHSIQVFTYLEYIVKIN